MFKKKEINYFDLFIDSAKVCNKAAIMLNEMLLGSADNFPTMVKEIHEIEHEGDKLYHTLYGHLDRSFITPLDREDMLAIARNIERTIDAIDEVAIMVDLLSVTKIRDVAKEMMLLVTKSAEYVLKATEEFKNFKKPTTLNKYIVEINNIEETGDSIYQNALRDLFSMEKDVLEVIKWNKILDSLENVLDTCENVADGLEAIILKNT